MVQKFHTRNCSPWCHQWALLLNRMDTFGLYPTGCLRSICQQWLPLPLQNPPLSRVSTLLAPLPRSVSSHILSMSMLFHSSQLLFSFTQPSPGVTLSTSQPSVFIDGQLFPNLLFQFSQLDTSTWMSWRHFNPVAEVRKKILDPCYFFSAHIQSMINSSLLWLVS